ncbi:HD domain-containing protein [Terribacillus saccharophilus]|uniref:HAD family hydrolase n=1 Tax=Terribacillus saccharophilus TaxID=361277 RepID=A0ABX4GWJ9_9BACI|nr:HD domain-containing protein [Terribacillus saccharophilus]PAD34959.1 HAD family hydrolase [Terribacillus saccharophilus]PAD95670.1 HAD family hydrolase [Terribacillus saccharophilus]PAD99240.1 HAD family hydrolase [Terribacillus saccharophilus]
MEHMRGIMQVLRLAEKLKFEMRHSWLSNGRQESVAEHTWRVGLMAVLIEPYIEEKLDMAKLLKMITIHDLVEAEAKDVPAFDTLFDRGRKKQKQLAESTAMDNIRAMLEEEPGKELQALWLEFEAKQTFEAKVANALDKLEAQLQHNEASMDTWLEIEKEMVYLLKPHSEFHPVLDELRQAIVAEAEEKMEAHGSVQSVGLSE